MKKNKNPNEERNSRVASYMISIGVHLLLFILFGLFLTVEAGGSQRGGASMAIASPIDVVMVDSSSSVTTKPVIKPVEEPKKPQVKPTPPVTTPPSPTDVITDRVQPVEQTQRVEKPKDKQPEPTVSDKSENESEDESQTQNPQKPSNENVKSGEANTSGKGSDLPRDTTGKGETDHPGVVPSSGPFPDGSFGGLKNVPECKKDDADNNDLTFKYNIVFSEGDTLPSIEFLSSTTEKISTSTIQQTMRILLESFNPDKIQKVPGRTFKGQMVCQCGYEPRCDLR